MKKPSAARSGRRCYGDHHRPRAGTDDRAGADFDNHQFGLLTVSLVIIALADRFLTSVSLTRLFSEKKSVTLTHHVVLAERRAGDRGVRGGVLLSDLIGDVLNNPDLAPLIKHCRWRLW